jgi:hypothetical protein
VRITNTDAMIGLIVIDIQAYQLMNRRLEKNSKTSRNMLM